MGKLAHMLKWADINGKTDRENYLSKGFVRYAFGGKDDPTLKALLKAENATDGAYLIQEEVYNTVIEGAEPVKCFRNILPVINVGTSSIRVVIGESGTYAPEVPEGGVIPIETQEYSKVDIPVLKYGCRPLVTNELIEDGLWDIVEMEVRKTGLRLENRLNRECLKRLLHSTNGFTTTATNCDAASAFTVADLADARTAVMQENFMPDTLVLSPIHEGFLFKDSNLVYANRAGTDVPLKNGQLLSTILGLKPFVCSATTGASTVSATAPEWGTATDSAGYYASMVFDSTAPPAMIAMRRDIQVEQYDDPIHDLIGVSCTMRFGVRTIHAKAGNNIEYR
jgi:hypothetical protein